jgi:protein-S-isoprenylcysteine O-methyltransferase Ste14
MKNTTSSALAPLPVTRSDPAALRQSRAWDLAMRLPVLSYSLFLALFSAAGLLRYLHAAEPAVPVAVFAVGLAMRASVIAYFVVLAGSVILRVRPKGRAEGVEPRLSALLGTFLIPAAVLFPRRDLSLAGEMVAILLVLGGNLLAVVILVQLGRSFSIMAEARRLVTSGLYRWVRHPLYLAEELAVIGIVLQFLSSWTALLLAIQIVFQLRRMVNEERVLLETFPDYLAYRQSTPMLFPGVRVRRCAAAHFPVPRG